MSHVIPCVIIDDNKASSSYRITDQRFCMLPQDSQFESTFARISLRGVLGGRRWFVVTCALIICLLNSVTTVQAGFVPFIDSVQLDKPSQIEMETSSEDAQWIAKLILKLHLGAEHKETVIRSDRVPNPSNAPLGLFSTGTGGLAVCSAGRNLPRPPVSPSGNSASGMFGSTIRLPISLLRYHTQQRGFLFLPDVPPFEVFRPS